MVSVESDYDFVTKPRLQILSAIGPNTATIRAIKNVLKAQGVSNGISPGNLWHHLNILKDYGYIETEEREKPTMNGKKQQPVAESKKFLKRNIIIYFRLTGKGHRAIQFYTDKIKEIQRTRAFG